jgi:hypothetical protein
MPSQYGQFNLHDGRTYLVVAKNLDYAEMTPVVYPIARLEGVKKTGEKINQRTIPVKVRVIGTSRADLETKLDALYAALALRQQPLYLHSSDSRYWIADAIRGQAGFVPGCTISVVVPVTFVCYHPYAYAQTSSTVTMPSQMFTLVSGTTWQSTVQTITGGGTVFARPTITITNNTSQIVTGINLYQLTDGLVLGTTVTMNQNDSLIIACDPRTSQGYTVTLNNGSPLAFTGQFPIQGPMATQWQIQSIASSAPTMNARWDWTPRYLG